MITGQYAPSGNTFSFDPQPTSVSKDVEVKWRIRRPGFNKKLERARFRYNEKLEFKIAGSCKGTKRDEIEWYSKRDSLFEIQNLDMNTYYAEETEDEAGTEKQYWTDVDEDDIETVYVVIENAKFTQTEGKENWFNYTLTLRRVNLTKH